MTKGYADGRYAMKDAAPSGGGRSLPALELRARGIYHQASYNYQGLRDPDIRFKLYPSASTDTGNLVLQLLRYVNKGTKKYQVVKEFTWRELQAESFTGCLVVNAGSAAALLSTVWYLSPSQTPLPTADVFRYGARPLENNIYTSFIVHANNMRASYLYKLHRRHEETNRYYKSGATPSMFSANFAARLKDTSTGEAGRLLPFNIALKKDNRTGRTDWCFVSVREFLPGIYKR